MGYGFFRTAIINEQEAVNYMARFLVNTIGWSVAEDVEDTGSSRRVVLSSPGEETVDNPNTIYIELWAASDYVYVTTYETFTDISTNTGMLHDYTYARVLCTGQNIITCVADLERITFTLQQGGGNTYAGYAGRISSYYKASEHPYPNLIKGMTSTIYDYLYKSNARSMFMLRSDGTNSRYDPIQITDSTDYPAYRPSGYRNSKIFMAAIPVHYNLDASYYEIAGELRGVYHTVGLDDGFHDYYNFDGKIYVKARSSTSTTHDFFIGPIADFGVPIVENPYTYWNDPLV